LKIDGIVPVIPTPFGSDENIEWSDLARLLDFACGSGACALCLPAFGSEFYKLSESERTGLVAFAAEKVGGRLPVIAQVNFVSTRQSIAEIRTAMQNGASAISVAIPRQFPVYESDIAQHLERLMGATDLTFLVQDFNPGGASITEGLVASLHKRHSNFRYLKLEEPMMGSKVRAMSEVTGGGVGVLEGWGGMYMLQLIGSGICGVMPGLGLADILSRVFHMARAGEMDSAFDLFQGVLPHIVFSLQNMELYHHVEKHLLQARGVISSTAVRGLALTVSADDRAFMDLNVRKILSLLHRLELPSGVV
jgi:4-hydroxy-tetrahydrodipicolinate synthase